VRKKTSPVQCFESTNWRNGVKTTEPVQKDETRLGADFICTVNSRLEYSLNYAINTGRIQNTVTKLNSSNS
jgi:hypothetical protein